MSRHLIPVFLFPDSLVFSREKTKTLSLYNPYDFQIKFSILSTNPNSLILSISEGIVTSRHCLDIAVRIRDSTIDKSKLLVTIQELNSSSNRCGEKQIDVNIREEEEEIINKRDKFSPCGHSSGVSDIRQVAMKDNKSQTLNIILAFILVLILLIPHDSDHWLSIGVTHKLVISYVLGLLTVIIIKT